MLFLRFGKVGYVSGTISVIQQDILEDNLILGQGYDPILLFLSVWDSEILDILKAFVPKLKLVNKSVHHVVYVK